LQKLDTVSVSFCAPLVVDHELIANDSVPHHLSPHYPHHPHPKHPHAPRVRPHPAVIRPPHLILLLSSPPLPQEPIHRALLSLDLRPSARARPIPLRSASLGTPGASKGRHACGRLAVGRGRRGWRSRLACFFL
jgi:hypothetical protein